jgi:hypothetical protein
MRRVLWWFQRKLLYPVQDFLQRGKYGWCPRDTWCLDYYLAKVIAESVGYLRKRGVGHPSNITQEEWNAILGKIVLGMKSYIKLEDPLEYDLEAKERLSADVADGFPLFQKWFGHLWE